MPNLTLKLLPETLSVHCLPENGEIPAEVFTASMYFISKVAGDMAVILPQSVKINSEEEEPDWQALEVVGPIDLSMTGILSKISTILANEQISLLAISTFDTDYFIVKSNKMAAAIAALRSNDYQII